MIPGGRADRAVKSVKRAGVRAAGGGALGAAIGVGGLVDTSAPAAVQAAAHAGLLGAGPTALIAGGAAVAAPAIYKGVKKMHSALRRDQFGK